MLARIENRRAQSRLQYVANILMRFFIEPRARFVLPGVVHAYAVCAAALWGMGTHAYAENSRSVVVLGAAVNNGTVIIDGVEVSPGAERYRSPSTGEDYLISRRHGSVTVTSAPKSASTDKNSGVKIEARAASGDSVNVGGVVIVVIK